MSGIRSGSGIRYGEPQYDTTISCMVSCGHTYAHTLSYEAPVRRQWDSSAGQNPLHNGEHFISQGEKYAEKATREANRFVVTAVIISVAIYLWWRFV